MNWTNVRLILAREVRDQLRDRRTLFMIAVLPLLLYPLLGMSFFQLAQFLREHEAHVLVLGAPELVELSDFPPLFENNRFAPGLFEAPDQAELFEITFASGAVGGDPDIETAIRARHLDLALTKVRQGEYQAVVDFPADFAERLERFRDQLLEIRPQDTVEDFESWKIPSPKIYHNSASEKSQIAYGRVVRVLERWTEDIGRDNLRASRVPIAAARPFDFEKNDVADSGHRDAALWSKLLPFVLLIWALTGAFYPAIDLCAGEKERGTLETLLSSPAERSEIVWGKLLTVMLFSVVTSLLNLASMGLTGVFVLSQLSRMNVLDGGTGYSMPSSLSLVWLVLALMPVAALFSALCLALAAFARSTKEGQYYLMPLVLVTMPLMILPMAPGVELTLGNSLIPITGVVLLLRTMIEGNYLQALPFVPPVMLVTGAGCWLAIRWAIDQFNKESVLFRESERLDVALWIRQLVRDRGPTPSIAEAFTCFFLILLIQFFISLAMTAPGDLRGTIERIFISQVVVIALPALLMAILLTRSLRETLLLRRPSSLMAIPAALLLAIVLHPIVQSLGLVVQQLYPLSPEVIEASSELLRPLLDSPYPWLPVLVIAVLPAICEELAFRGFILSGLRHLGHKWWAIGLSAVFFGMAHTVLQQSLLTAMVGVVLGYLAVQSGSLWPSVVFHVTHNSLALCSAKLPDYLTRAGLADRAELQYFIEITREGAEASVVYGWPLILFGALVAGYLFAWLHRLVYQKSSEEQLQEALDHQTALEM